ncbi:MAG: hypothetical protein OEW31_11625 [Thermoleophilia bacterium]|nr:hypothetical protein [Thermoleophilia bacterium]
MKDAILVCQPAAEDACPAVARDDDVAGGLARRCAENGDDEPAVEWTMDSR